MALHESNKSKAKNGNIYSGVLFSDLRKNMSLYNIRKLNKEKKFFYDQKTIDEIIALRVINNIKKNGLSDSESTIVRLAKAETKKFLEENKNNVIRNRNKFYKRADITFHLYDKYIYNGKSKDIRIVIDTTTSARDDRIKAKAQDADVYKSFNMPHLYFIVLPDDEYFEEAGFKNVKNEINSCKNVIYKANFCNEYAKEGITLILQEKDLKAYLKYIKTKPGEDILSLNEKWKNRYFNKLASKRKEELKKFRDELTSNVTAIVMSKI